MAKVKAKVKVFVDNVFHDEGAIFEYNGPDNPNLEEVDKDGNVIEKAKAKEDPKPKPAEDEDDEEEKYKPSAPKTGVFQKHK